MARLVHTSVEGDVGVVALDRPPSNLLSLAAIEAIGQAAASLARDPEVRALVVAGDGEHFSAGIDLPELGEVAGAERALALSRQARAVTDALAGPLPTVAAVHGYCLGGGLELALACHLRVAGAGARLGQPEVRVGLVPGMGGTQRLARLIGPSRALELLLTGDPISAAAAERLGLVDRVVPDAELRLQAVALARRLGACSRPAVTRILRAVRDGLELPLPEALELEGRLFAESLETEDSREGIAAFVARRAPRFRDR